MRLYSASLSALPFVRRDRSAIVAVAVDARYTPQARASIETPMFAEMLTSAFMPNMDGPEAKTTNDAAIKALWCSPSSMPHGQNALKIVV